VCVICISHVLFFLLAASELQWLNSDLMAIKGGISKKTLRCKVKSRKRPRTWRNMRHCTKYGTEVTLQPNQLRNLRDSLWCLPRILIHDGGFLLDDKFPYAIVGKFYCHRKAPTSGHVWEQQQAADNTLLGPVQPVASLPLYRIPTTLPTVPHCRRLSSMI
jgi:hypothetical protein